MPNKNQSGLAYYTMAISLQLVAVMNYLKGIKYNQEDILLDSSANIQKKGQDY